MCYCLSCNYRYTVLLSVLVLQVQLCYCLSCCCRYTVLRPRFSTRVLGEDVRLLGYRSSAVLPNNSPVRIAEGQIQRTRALAQASASLEACKQLHQVRPPPSHQDTLDWYVPPDHPGLLLGAEAALL